jgi:hypothetical protein
MELNTALEELTNLQKERPFRVKTKKVSLPEA